MTTKQPDTHEQAPDLLLTTATLLRDHLGSIGQGKKAEALNEILKPLEETAKAKAAADQTKADAAQQKADDKEAKHHGR